MSRSLANRPGEYQEDTKLHMHTLWTCALQGRTGVVTDLRQGRACPQSCQLAGAVVLPLPLSPDLGLPGQNQRPPAWARCGRPSAIGPLHGGQEHQAPPLALRWLPRRCLAAPRTPQETGQTGSLLLHVRPYPLRPRPLSCSPHKMYTIRYNPKQQAA